MNAKSNVTGWQAFRNGLSRSRRYPQLLLAAYLASLLSGLLLMVIPALSLTGPAHRPAIREAAAGIEAWLVLEVNESPMTYALLHGESSATLSPGFQQGILVGVLTLLGALALAWIPASFLSGGVLLTYSESPPTFSWQRFFWGCWRWLGAFLLLNALQGVMTLVLFGGLLAGASFTASAAGGWVNWITLPLIVLITALWLALIESTRFCAVAGGTRNIFRAFGRAVALIFRHPLAMLSLYGLALMLLALLHIFFRAGLMPRLPLDWWPLVLVVGQAFVFLRLWAQLTRWAGVAEVASSR